MQLHMQEACFRHISEVIAYSFFQNLTITFMIIFLECVYYVLLAVSGRTL